MFIWAASVQQGKEKSCAMQYIYTIPLQNTNQSWNLNKLFLYLIKQHRTKYKWMHAFIAFIRKVHVYIHMKTIHTNINITSQVIVPGKFLQHIRETQHNSNTQKHVQILIEHMCNWPFAPSKKKSCKTFIQLLWLSQHFWSCVRVKTMETVSNHGIKWCLWQSEIKKQQQNKNKKHPTVQTSKCKPFFTHLRSQSLTNTTVFQSKPSNSTE